MRFRIRQISVDRTRQRLSNGEKKYSFPRIILISDLRQKIGATLLTSTVVSTPVYIFVCIERVFALFISFSGFSSLDALNAFRPTGRQVFFEIKM